MIAPAEMTPQGVSIGLLAGHQTSPHGVSAASLIINHDRYTKKPFSSRGQCPCGYVGGSTSPGAADESNGLEG